MVSISVDGKLLYTESMIDKGYSVINPKLTCELGSAGSLEFSIPTENPLYSSIAKLKSDVEVTIKGKNVFMGRSVSDERDFYKRKTVYCEGALSFLVDGVVPPYKYENVTVASYMNHIVWFHNRTLGETDSARVASNRMFLIGNVYGVDDSETVSFECSTYSDPLTELENNVIATFGGYLYVTKDGGIYRLNYATDKWIQDNSEDSEQTIKFGENLLDLTEQFSATDICTVLIPYGDEIKSESEGDGAIRKYVTLGTLGSTGSDYLVADSEYIDIFGRITKSMQFEGCSTPEALLEKATEYIKSTTALALEIELNAVDISVLGANPDVIQVGSKVKVTSIPHGIVEQSFICTKVEYDLANWSSNVYTFGPTKTTLTSLQASAVKNERKILVKTISAGDSIRTIEETLTKLPEDYVSSETYVEFSGDVNEQFIEVDRRLKSLGG